MDKKLAKTVQTEAVAALKEIAEKYGMSVSGRGGTIASDISMTLKFEFKTADTATLRAAEEAEFKSWAAAFGLLPSDYRAKFRSSGVEYTLVGFDLKRRKYPLIAEDENGKRMMFTDVLVDRIKAARTAA